MSDIELDSEDTFAIRQVEHLTNFIWNLFDSFKEGADDLASAKQRVALELQRCAAESFLLTDDALCAWMRLSGDKDELELAEALMATPGHVITFRWLGARQEDDKIVAWAVVGFEDFGKFLEAVAALKADGIEIRDANFGGVVL